MVNLSRSSSSTISSSFIELEVDFSNTIPPNNHSIQKTAQDIFKEVWPNIKQNFVFDNFSNLKFEDKCQIARDITLAVMIFEELKHFHLDIKPENIVLFQIEGKIRAKLVDFGYAEGHLTEDSIKTLEEDSLLRGALSYIDTYGAIDSHLKDKNNINLIEKNRFLLRRDRVALSRVLLELFLGPENCEELLMEGMKASEWIVDRSKDLDFLTIYDRLKDRTANYSLKEAIDCLHYIEKMGELV